MAYPTIDKPYGLKPVNLVGGLPFAGATRQVPIASGYATSIFFGDTVRYQTDGTLIIDASTTAIAAATGILGVFVGCSYTNPATKQKLFSQYYPSGTVASDIVAYVVDDPNTLFKVAVVSGTTVIASVGRTVVGGNIALVQNAGTAATGNSQIAVLSSSAAATSTLPMRVMDVVPETATGADAFVELIVKFNFGAHSYNIATGTA